VNTKWARRRLRKIYSKVAKQTHIPAHKRLARMLAFESRELGLKSFSSASMNQTGLLDDVCQTILKASGGKKRKFVEDIKEYHCLDCMTTFKSAEHDRCPKCHEGENK